MLYPPNHFHPSGWNRRSLSVIGPITTWAVEADSVELYAFASDCLPTKIVAYTSVRVVLEPASARGCVTWRVDRSGAAVVESTDAAVGLVCLVHAQSELGTLQPVAAAAAVARAAGAPLFVDAAQSLGRVPLADVLESADALALSPHKCGGLRGHAVLVIRGGASALRRPLLRGGGQEQGMRPGTQSPALCAANALAITRALEETERRGRRMAEARAAFLAGLRASRVEHHILTPLPTSLPNTLMIAFEDVDGRSLLPLLDLAGVRASHGSACASGSPEPPAVLRAIGMPESLQRAAVRFSFGWRDAADELAQCGRTVGETVHRRHKKN